MQSPLLLPHIIGGTLGSGFVAVLLRKGSRWHGVAGNVFFISSAILAPDNIARVRRGESA